MKRDKLYKISSQYVMFEFASDIYEAFLYSGHNVLTKTSFIQKSFLQNP